MDNKMIDKLEHELRKLGYSNIKRKNRTTVLVYVPRSDRNVVLDDLASKFDSEIDTSPKTLNNISSVGAVKLDGGKYAGYMIGVKPDMSRALVVDEHETLAGIFIATKLANSATKFSLEDLKKHGDKAIVSKYKIDDLYEKAGKGWINSSTIVANAIAPHSKGQYQVHHRSGSKFLTKLYARAKTLLKDSDHQMSFLNNIQNDKWNPGDIWLIKPPYANHDFSKYTSIAELNQFLESKFDSKDIISISLKLVKKTAKVETFNKKKLPPIKYEGYDLGKTGFVNAMNGTVYFSGQSMVIRSFGRPQAVSAEINGKMAQGGKVSGNALADVWTNHDKGFKLTSHHQIIADYQSDPTKVFGTLYQHMIDLDKASLSKYPDLDAFISAIKSRDNNELIYLISKTQVSELVKSLNKMTQKDRDALVGELVSYAMSATDVSSVFYKIS